MLHRTDNSLKLQEARQEVRAEFEEGNGGIPALRRLLRLGLARICQRPYSQIQEWLYQVRLNRRVALESPDIRSLQAMQASLRHFLELSDRTGAR